DVKADADLRLTGTREAPELGGSVRVFEGNYTGVTKSLKPAKEAPPTRPPEIWTSLAMNVGARWESNVWYREGLTKIESRADLQVHKDRGSNSIYLAGTLDLRRGSYDAYGRDFIIQSGEL